MGKFSPDWGCQDSTWCTSSDLLTAAVELSITGVVANQRVDRSIRRMLIRRDGALLAARVTLSQVECGTTRSKFGFPRLGLEWNHTNLESNLLILAGEKEGGGGWADG